MKLKIVKVPKFIHNDGFGDFEFSNVEILFDPDENEITPETFNQYNDEYFLDDNAIEKLSHESAMRFYNARVKEVLLEVSPLAKRELKAIKDFFGVSGVGLGDLIGLDKSSISRVLNGKQPLMLDRAKSLMDCLREEINSPGYSKIVLSNLKPQNLSDSLRELGMDTLEVAEYFVRKFNDLDSSITQLKLQKLLYYAQGIGFGRYGVKLFNEPLLAWEHGPVARNVYDKYKVYKKTPLEISPDLNVESLNSDETVLNILEETIAVYGIYDAWVLRTKTHNESPWLETERDNVITDEKMITCFRKLLV